MSEQRRGPIIDDWLERAPPSCRRLQRPPHDPAADRPIVSVVVLPALGQIAYLSPGYAIRFELERR
jgi:hypothetical protein